eukprot:SAG11_NODE_34851_length_269_cov_2.417647_1_plen_32_part_10
MGALEPPKLLLLCGVDAEEDGADANPECRLWM